MTNPFQDAGGPGGSGHAGTAVLAGYATGQVTGAAAWSIEAHLTTCPACRLALSDNVGPERLARNRSVLLAAAAIPDGGWIWRVLRRCGVPDQLLRLLAATPSLRRSWLLSVIGVLAVVTGEVVLAGYHSGVGGAPGPQVLEPLLLLAPLLALASVAAAFMPPFDPACQLAVAAPFSGFTLLLVRAVSALGAAVIPVVCAAFVVPGPAWLPAAFVLPSLALCAVALAAR